MTENPFDEFPKRTNYHDFASHRFSTRHFGLYPAKDVDDWVKKWEFEIRRAFTWREVLKDIWVQIRGENDKETAGDVIKEWQEKAEKWDDSEEIRTEKSRRLGESMNKLKAVENWYLTHIKPFHIGAISAADFEELEKIFEKEA